MTQSLCQLANDWRGKMPPGGAVIQEKVDGWRAIYIRDINGNPTLFTRNGIPIEGTAHILHWCEEIERAAGEPLMIDGEFQVDGSLDATKQWCERGWKQGGEAGRFYAFDCMTLAEWRAGGTDRGQVDRLAMLEHHARAAVADDWTWRPGSRGRDERQAPIVILPWQWALSGYDVLALARQVWLEGREGVMVKQADAPYRRNRNGHWLKVKVENAAKWSALHRAEAA